MRPTLTVEVQTRFADLDPLGHVNNVAFFTYMETARIVFMHEHGAGLRGQVLVVNSECHHRHEIAASVKTVSVDVSVERVGRTSFTVLHELRDGEVRLATGRVVVVAVDAAQRPRPITEAERQALTGQSGGR